MSNYNVRFITVAPGKLGVIISCKDSHFEYGAIIKAILPTCPFKGEVKVGQHIIYIDGKRVVTNDDLLRGSDKVRRLGIISNPASADSSADGRGGIISGGYIAASKRGCRSRRVDSNAPKHEDESSSEEEYNLDSDNGGESGDDDSEVVIVDSSDDDDEKKQPAKKKKALAPAKKKSHAPSSSSKPKATTKVNPPRNTKAVAVHSKKVPALPKKRTAASKPKTTLCLAQHATNITSSTHPPDYYRILAYQAFQDHNDKRAANDELPFKSWAEYHAYLKSKKLHAFDSWVDEIPSLRNFDHKQVRNALDTKSKWMDRIRRTRAAAEKEARYNEMDITVEEVDMSTPESIVEHEKGCTMKKVQSVAKLPKSYAKSTCSDTASGSNSTTARFEASEDEDDNDREDGDVNSYTSSSSSKPKATTKVSPPPNAKAVAVHSKKVPALPKKRTAASKPKTTLCLAQHATNITSSTHPPDYYRILAYQAFQDHNDKRAANDELPFKSWAEYHAYLKSKKLHAFDSWVDEIPSLRNFDHKQVRNALDTKSKWMDRIRRTRAAAEKEARYNEMDITVEEVDVSTPEQPQRQQMNQNDSAEDFEQFQLFLQWKRSADGASSGNDEGTRSRPSSSKAPCENNVQSLHNEGEADARKRATTRAGDGAATKSGNTTLSFEDEDKENDGRNDGDVASYIRGEDYDQKHNKDMALASHLTSKSITNHHVSFPDQMKDDAQLKRLLRSKSFVSLGDKKVKLIKELGSGTYGSVWLVYCYLRDSSQPEVYALKVQSPSGSLPMEFQIQSILEYRLGNQNDGRFPFPLPIAFHKFTDDDGDSGSLFFMSAELGVTLHSVYTDYFPENAPVEIVVYLADKMLTVLEMLHCEGKYAVSCLFEHLYLCMP